MEFDYVSFNLYPSVDNGVVSVDKSGMACHYKTKREAIKSLCKLLPPLISTIFPPGDGDFNDDGFGVWCKDFQKKLEWICKD